MIDRFRNRLVIPIARDTGSIIAFGARALQPDQQPKYLNSRETPIYSKARTLYGLHLSKSAIREAGYAVLVEGYFDLAQAVQAGVTPVVAACGTAVSEQQVTLLKRFTSKVIVSFDPDPAGDGAAARSGELLLAKGLQVNIAVLADGEDPDRYIRRHGAAGYLEKLRASRPYLEYLLDREAAQRDLTRGDHQREFLTRMLHVAARIPDAATRDLFADRLAHKARILEDVVRMEIRKAAVARRTTLHEAERQVSARPPVKTAEKGADLGARAEHAIRPRGDRRVNRRRLRRAGDGANSVHGPVARGLAGRHRPRHAPRASKYGGGGLDGARRRPGPSAGAGCRVRGRSSNGAATSVSAPRCRTKSNGASSWAHLRRWPRSTCSGRRSGTC